VTDNSNDVLARLHATLPESHAAVARIAAEVAAEGLSERLLPFVLEEYTWALLGRRPVAAEPDLAGWQRWVDFLDGEYGRDPALDETINYWVLANLPTARGQEDPHRLKDALGPRLAEALDAFLAMRERLRPEPDPTTEAFLVRLAERFPDLQTYIEENRDGDQLLRTSILSDVARHLTSLYAEGGDGRRRAQEIIDAIEEAYGESYSLDMAIATGFVELLPYSHEPHAAVTELLGPRLRRVWEGHGPASTAQ